MRVVNSDHDHQIRAGIAGGAVNGDRKRGTGRNDWYVKDGQRHQHRSVAERLLGRPLTSSDEDFDKKNNDPSNLIVFPDQGAHMRHHLWCMARGECRCLCIRFSA